MKSFHFYHRDTGLLHEKTVVLNVPDDEIERSATANAPPDHASIEGRFDRLSQRVEFTPNVWGDGVDGLSERRVVDWQPPAPSDDHEWNAEARRWVLSATAAERNRKRLLAQARIRDLEVAQARRVRELLAQDDDRLRAIDQEISALRADL